MQQQASHFQSKLLQGEEHKQVQGPAGFIEIGYASTQVPMGQALVCHPHPQYGGTMYNKVVTTVVKSCQKKRMNTCRFNYRGVGQSQGTYDEGQGEVDDALAVGNWFIGQSDLENLWLVGFSFGAYVAYQAARRLPVKGLILIAPAITRMNFDQAKEPELKTWVIHGKQDELIPFKEVDQWAETRKFCQNVEIIPQASHFFHGCLDELSDSIARIIGA